MLLLKLTAFAVISQSILLKLTAFAVISRFFSNSGFHFQSWCNSQGPFWRTRADCFGWTRKYENINFFTASWTYFMDFALAIENAELLWCRVTVTYVFSRGYLRIFVILVFLMEGILLLSPSSYRSWWGVWALARRSEELEPRRPQRMHVMRVGAAGTARNFSGSDSYCSKHNCLATACSALFPPSDRLLAQCSNGSFG